MPSVLLTSIFCVSYTYFHNKKKNMSYDIACYAMKEKKTVISSETIIMITKSRNEKRNGKLKEKLEFK